MFEDEEYLSDDYFENFDVDSYYDDNFGFRSYSYSDEDFEDCEDYFPFIEEDYERSYSDELWEDYLDYRYYEYDNFGDHLDDWG